MWLVGGGGSPLFFDVPPGGSFKKAAISLRHLEKSILEEKLSTRRTKVKYLGGRKQIIKRLVS